MNTRLGLKDMQAPGLGTNLCWQPTVKYFASGSSDRDIRIFTTRMLRYLWGAVDGWDLTMI